MLLEHPADLDARIGLASSLLRRGAWREALTMLLGTGRDAPENPDLLGVLARQMLWETARR